MNIIKKILNVRPGKIFLKPFGIINVFLVCTGFQFVTKDCGHLIGKWRINGGPAVKYVVDANSLNTLNFFTGNASTALTDIIAAADAWTLQTGSSFKFVYSGTYTNDSKLHMRDYCTSSDSRPANQIPARVFVSTTEPQRDPTHPSLSNPNVLAWVAQYYCQGPYSGGRYSTAQLKGFEMWIRPTHLYSSGNSTLVSGVDLRATVTHEFGHALGLHHNTVDGQIPYAQDENTGEKYLVTNDYPGISDPPCDQSNPSNYASMCKTVTGMMNRTLTADDIQGMYALYGPPSSPKLEIRETEGMSQANFSNINNENHWIKSAWTAPVPNFGDPSKFVSMTVQYTDCHRMDSGWIQRDFRTDTYQYGDQFELGLFLCKRCDFMFPFFFNDHAEYRIKKRDVAGSTTTFQKNFNDWKSPWKDNVGEDHVCTIEQKIGVIW